MLAKSQRNKEVADWAENRKYYDVAISRYYYCIFQKIIFLSLKYDFYQAPPKGEDTHNYTLNNFRKNMHTKLAPEEITWIEYIKKIKENRVTADYFPDRLENTNEYNLVIKSPFNSINEILDKYVG